MSAKTIIMQFLMTIMLFSGAVVAEKDVKDGIKAYDEDDYDKAFSILSNMDIEKNLKAKFYLGVMHYQGLGCDVNTEKGEGLIKASAVAGYLEAKMYLASEFINGHTKAINKDELFEYLNDGVDKNNFFALNELAWLLYDGTHIKLNMNLAYKYFEKAAHLGSFDSFYALALMNSKGEGTPKNYSKAYMWATMGAEAYDRRAFDLLNELNNKIPDNEKEKILDKAAETMLPIIEKMNKWGLTPLILAPLILRSIEE